MITFGRKMKDKVTGFTGVATGYCTYLTGCERVLLVPPVGDDGKIRDGEWFDEARCDYVDDTVVTLNPIGTKGADIDAPKN